jgi:hypothetical protein
MMKRFSLMTIAGLAALLLATAPRALADTPCVSSTAAQAINGNLVVPHNGNCNLSGGGTVSGNVTVGSGGALTLNGNWVITGNLQATNCDYVNLNTNGNVPVAHNTVVGGNVEVLNCSGGIGIGWAFFNQPGTVIMGDFRCLSNNAACYLLGATVGGNVEMQNNVYTPPIGPLANTTVKTNTILKNLVCVGNSPAPLVGKGTNTVIGNNNHPNEGQCLGF